MNQLNLFTGSIGCDYCGGGPAKPGKPHIWDGFRDQDTGHTVCRQCRDEHYVKKARDLGTLKPMKNVQAPVQILELIDPYIIEFMTYSEMPVVIGR